MKTRKLGEKTKIIQRNNVLDEYKRLWKREISIYENKVETESIIFEGEV